MRTLQEITDSARQGDIISRKVLYYKYFYLVENYHEYYHFSYAELKKFYDQKFMQYMENDCVQPLQKYIYQSFYYRYSAKVNVIDKPVTYLFDEAKKCKGTRKTNKKIYFFSVRKIKRI